jgi:glycosyltransferase involved in cell wall biosynthesis
MKISYAITVCDELKELKTLLNKLIEHNIETRHEIIILHDMSKSNEDMEEYLEYLSENSKIIVYRDLLNKNFSYFKNKLLNISNGDYIFQIDADEIPSDSILEYLEYILEENSEVDCFNVPRRNIVEGITQEHIQKWGWNVNEDGYINFNDPQMRIFKNNGDIKWLNKVHEKLYGYKCLSTLPNDFFLWHIKDIHKQELQNNFYNNINQV